MAVNNEGKYTKFEPNTIKLLEEAFAMDCPVTEACLHDNISQPTYYAWIKENPKLEERFKELREKPYLIARTTINKAIKENPQYAFEYMRRKKRKEFGDNVDLTTDGLSINVINFKNADNNTTQLHSKELSA